MFQGIGPGEGHKIHGPHDLAQKCAVDLPSLLELEPIGLTVARPMDDPADRAIGRADFIEQARPSDVAVGQVAAVIDSLDAAGGETLEVYLDLQIVPVGIPSLIGRVTGGESHRVSLEP